MEEFLGVTGVVLVILAGLILFDLFSMTKGKDSRPKDEDSHNIY